MKAPALGTGKLLSQLACFPACIVQESHAEHLYCSVTPQNCLNIISIAGKFLWTNAGIALPPCGAACGALGLGAGPWLRQRPWRAAPCPRSSAAPAAGGCHSGHAGGKKGKTETSDGILKEEYISITFEKKEKKIKKNFVLYFVFTDSDKKPDLWMCQRAAENPPEAWADIKEHCDLWQ